MKKYDFSKVKMIASDLDGTLLLPSGQPSSLTIDVLNKLHEQGIIIVINSGRPLSSISKSCKDIPYDWAIGMNGQEILNAHNNSIITNKPLYKEDLVKIYQLSQKYHLICNMHDDNFSAIIFNKRNLLFGIIYNFLEDFRWIGKQKKGHKKSYYFDINNCDCKQIGKICFAGLSKDISALAKEIKETMPQYKSLCVSKNWLEVMDYSISKGNGLKQVLALENINSNNCIAFGDGENDIELLQACGYSCAMKNAMPNTKQAASEIIDSNVNDGVAKFLKEYILKSSEH